MALLMFLRYGHLTFLRGIWAMFGARAAQHVCFLIRIKLLYCDSGIGAVTKLLKMSLISVYI